MKKQYEELTLEIIRFGAADIITASDAAETTKEETAANDTTAASDDTAVKEDTGSETGNDGTDDSGATALFVDAANPEGQEATHTLTPAGTFIAPDGSVYTGYTDESGTTWLEISGDTGSAYLEKDYWFSQIEPGGGLATPIIVQ